MKCRYCGAPNAKEVAFSHVPKGSNVASKTNKCCEECKQAGRAKEEKAAFDEMDANCNTCANLRRTKCTDRLGFLKGVCRASGLAVFFHPSDYMGLECWIPRGGGQ